MSTYNFDMSRTAGQLVLEHTAKTGIYMGEKCYQLTYPHDEEIIKFKGIPKRMFHILPNITTIHTNTVIGYNRFEIHKHYGMVVKHFARCMRNNVCPRKRYFKTANQSVPIDITM